MTLSMKRELLIGAAVLFCGAGAARANCSWTVGSLAFGAYNVFTASPNDSVANITSNCNSNNVQISIAHGNAPSFSPRQLKSGANVLQYNLYRDAGRTQIWGDGSGVTFIYTNSNYNSTTVPIYGRIFMQQAKPAGAYTDTMVVSINF